MSLRNILCILGVIFGSFMSAQATSSRQAHTPLTKAYHAAHSELLAMLNNEQPLDIERAVFVLENAHYGNAMSYSNFQQVLDKHEVFIKKIVLQARDKSIADFSGTVLQSAASKKKAYDDLKLHWALFSYMTDTTVLFHNDTATVHLPFTYSAHDPFAMQQWSNAEVTGLLTNGSGNCFALATFYKIMAQRLGIEASLTVAPGHIYIRHRDHRGRVFNLELSGGDFLGSGSIQTLTYSSDNTIQLGGSMRELTDREFVALSLVYLGKSYQQNVNSRDDRFVLQCADNALRYDAKSLNALLLQLEVLQERVLEDNQNLESVNGLRLNQTASQLYQLGYREMPEEMRERIMAPIVRQEALPSTKNHTPHTFGGGDYHTASSGTFEETETNQSKICKFGRVLFDSEKHSIVSLDPYPYLKPNIDFVVFALSVDPMAHLRTWVSPYNFVQNNPILRIDPDGRLDGEYDVVKNDDGTTTTTKISDLGDEDGIDFFHQMNGDRQGDTKIVNNNTGETNWVNDGVKYIRGYTQRGDNTNWNSVYQEWQSGTGPENSLFYGRDNPMIKDIRTSNLYHGARNEYLKDKAWDFDNKISKKYIPMSFGLSGLLLSGTNMTMQMMGSGGVSFYDIGNNQRLTIITDQKTKESFYYHLPWINNISRTGSGTQPRQSTTNQTYIWIDNNVEQ